MAMASDDSSDDDQDFERLVIKAPTFINAKAQMKKFDTVVDDVSNLINLSVKSRTYEYVEKKFLVINMQQSWDLNKSRRKCYEGRRYVVNVL